MRSACIFCRIVGGAVDGEIVHEGSEVVAFRDIDPKAPSHILVVPKRHVARIEEFDAERDGAWLAELVSVANAVARSEGLDGGYRLVINNGPDGGQAVEHVHLHLLGGRRMGWPPG